MRGHVNDRMIPDALKKSNAFGSRYPSTGDTMSHSVRQLKFCGVPVHGLNFIFGV